MSMRLVNAAFATKTETKAQKIMLLYLSAHCIDCQASNETLYNPQALTDEETMLRETGLTEGEAREALRGLKQLKAIHLAFDDLDHDLSFEFRILEGAPA